MPQSLAAFAFRPIAIVPPFSGNNEEDEDILAIAPFPKAIASLPEAEAPLPMAMDFPKLDRSPAFAPKPIAMDWLLVPFAFGPIAMAFVPVAPSLS